MENDIIIGKVDGKELLKSIETLVSTSKAKMEGMATSFQSSADKMDESLKKLSTTTRTHLSEIKASFQELGVTFDEFAKIMERISKKQNGTGAGGGLGSGGKTTKATFKSSMGDNALLGELEQAKREVEELRRQLRANGEPIKQLTRNIEELKQRIREAKTSMNFSDVMRMNENSISAIAAKIRALKNVRLNTTNAEEVKRVATEISRLNAKQKELMGTNLLVEKSNRMLASAFGYLRNRILYAFTIGAVRNFAKELYNVRGEYELLERSIGILIDNMRKGTQVFNELNDMALKSPFTLMELASGAKQLAAYNFTANELVDTTRRLADISSALGVPMERLVYNLGQVRAQTVLNARDARDFANAGLAIIPMLAKMYTEEKRFGDELVTTSRVYSMMTKKMVSYEDVMKVINQITNEGGKFYNFQAKQAETLKVQMNNLTLAYNNMLNDIGKKHQNVLEKPLHWMRDMFNNWETIAKSIGFAATALSTYLVTMKGIPWVIRNLSLMNVAWKKIIASMQAMKLAIASNPFGMLATVLASVVSYIAFFGKSVDDLGEYVSHFGNEGAKTVRDVELLFDSLQSMTEGSKNYQESLGELVKILEEYDIKLVNEKSSQNDINSVRERAIGLLREEISARHELQALKKNEEDYSSRRKTDKSNLYNALSGSVQSPNVALTEVFSIMRGLGFKDTVNKNAKILSDIIDDTTEKYAHQLATTSGERYKRVVEQIYDDIQTRIDKLGIKINIKDVALREGGLDFYREDILYSYIQRVGEARKATEDYAKNVKKAAKNEQELSDKSVTLNDRINRTYNEIHGLSTNVEQFKEKLDSIVKDYAKEHNIDFNVRIKQSGGIPQWMMNMDLKRLSELAARFAAIAEETKRGGWDRRKVNGVEMTLDQIYMRAAQYAQAYEMKAANEEANETNNLTQKAQDALNNYKKNLEALKVLKNKVAQGTATQSDVTKKEKEVQESYNEALEKGVSLGDLRNATQKKEKKSGDALNESLKEGIQLIDKMNSSYDKLTNKGVGKGRAKTIIGDAFGEDIATLNALLKKNGLEKLDVEQIVGEDNPQKLLDYLVRLREALVKNGLSNSNRLETLDAKIQELKVDAEVYNIDKIKKGIKDELGKLKEGFEIGKATKDNRLLESIYRDIFNIDTKNVPTSIYDYMDRVRETFTKKFGTPLDIFKATEDDWNNWGNQMNISEDALKSIQEEFKGASDFAKKYLEDLAKQTLEINDKFRDSVGKITKLRDEIGKLEKEYEKAQGAEKIYIEAVLQERKHALSELENESIKLLPFYRDLFGQVYNISTKRLNEIAKKAREIMKPFDAKTNLGVKQGKDEKGKTQFELFYMADDDTIKKQVFSLEEYQRIMDKIQDAEKKVAKENPWKKIHDAFKRVMREDGVNEFTNYAQGMEAIATEMGKLQKIGEEFGTLGQLLGLDDSSLEIINDVSASMSGLSSIAQGMAAWANQDYLGAVMGVMSGVTTIISTWADNSDKRISREIEKSERRVKRLELAYIDLEHAIEAAYGTEVIGAQKVAVANKQLQLIELNRQLELEKSRKKKHRDEDRIIELKKQIKELQYEIEDSTNNLVNDLLGISSVGDFAENLVSSMIDAFKNGEDYMKVFEDSFEDMVDNMIMKAITTKIVSSYIDSLWSGLEQKINDRTNDEESALQQAMSLNEQVSNLSDRDIAKILAEQKDYWINIPVSSGRVAKVLDYNRITQAEIDAYRKSYQDAETTAREALKKASEISNSDIDYLVTQLGIITPELGEKLKEILGEYYKFGQSGGDSSLSALQQGIRGMTEEQGTALEAYWNANTQQQYIQSNLLRDIKAILSQGDSDLQLSTSAKILLQLQQSYQIQASIESMMRGWSSDNGRSLRVEML